MEKSISQEERIRRAEEIYSRRRYNNRYGESLYRSGETRNRYQPQETRKIKGKMINKMIIQMIVCVIIYTCIYMLKYSNLDMASELLIVVDDLERAIKIDDDVLDDELSKFLSGFKMIYTRLINILNNFEIKEIEALGKEFDPRYHQAVLTDNVSDKDNNIILDVLQKGYMYKDKVIRPAMVKVNIKGEDKHE